MQPSAVHWTEIDLDLAAAQRSVQELQLGEDKPMLSSKAQARIARRNRSPTGREGLVVAAAAHPMSSLATSTLVAGPQGALSLGEINIKLGIQTSLSLD